MNTRKWRCHNYSCGMGAMENLMQYHMKTGTNRTKGPRSTSWQSTSSISLLAEQTCFQIVLYACNLLTANINTLWMSSFLHIMWTDKACFMWKGIFKVHNSHLWAQENPHATHRCRYHVNFSASVWAGLLGTLSWAPICYLRSWQQGCLTVSLWLWGRSCGFHTTDLQHTMGKVSHSGWTRHTQEGELNVEGRLHGLLGRWS